MLGSIFGRSNKLSVTSQGLKRFTLQPGKYQIQVFDSHPNSHQVRDFQVVSKEHRVKVQGQTVIVSAPIAVQVSVINRLKHDQAGREPSRSIAVVEIAAV